MLKIGVIGLGDIAQKAYLPVFSKLEQVEIHIFTRNPVKLMETSLKYRFPNTHASLSSLIESGIKGAFVHSSTDSHYQLVKELLLNGIHVYVDKPISYQYDHAKELVELAEDKGLILMTGFNRRFAPFYRQMKEVIEPNLVILQKNRHSLPGDIRTFVFDDFIHVIDTVRFIFNDEIKNITVTGRKREDLLYHVVVQFQSNSMTGIAIMNRDSGAVEEKLEVMGPYEKRIVEDLDKLAILQNHKQTNISFNNWDSTLYKRGFEQIVNEFIHAVLENNSPSVSPRDSLRTHEICEEVVKQLKNG